MVDIQAVKDRLTDIEIMPSDTLIASLLDGVKWAIINRRYPFGNIPKVKGKAVVPERYEDLQIRMVIELIRKLGNEGMIQRSDGGVSTQWASANISPELKGEILPMAGGIARDSV